ncbi:MAG: response regulator transcription factor [Anaerolineae bacterium]
MAQNKVRILVVDDEQDLLWALQRHLGDDGYEVHTAEDGVEGLRLARAHHPHLIILDVAMPRMGGIEMCRELRQDPTLAATPVLFLTVRKEVDDRVKGLDAGGDDYLVKPFAIEELKARVRALLRRAHVAVEAGTERLDYLLVVGSLTLDLHRRQARVGDKAVTLTPTEYDLLYYLMKHPDEVFSSERLLQALWGYLPNSASACVVRWHIKNIRSKIEPDPEHPIFIRTVSRHGYMLPSKQEAVSPV